MNTMKDPLFPTDPADRPLGASPPERSAPRPPAAGGGSLSVKHQANNAAQSTVRDVREQALSVADRGRGEVAEQLGGVARALRRAGEELRKEESPAARYTDGLSDRIENMSSYLEERDATRLIRDVEGFARRRPELFLGGAFLLGLAASRFLKSSDEESDSLSPSGVSVPTKPYRYAGDAQ